MAHKIAFVVFMIVTGLTAVAFAEAPPPISIEQEVSDVGKWVENTLRKMGEPLENVDIGGLLEAYREKRTSGLSRKEATQWVADELNGHLLSFAPLDAVHRPRRPYALPFDASIPRMLGQGIDGSFSHSGNDRHGFDFIMPIGTEILAARRGKVVAVRDGATLTNAFTNPEAGAGNSVKILHPDGTFAVYAHLSAGIPVTDGSRVKLGALIGYSGQSGYAMHPHLHFDVRKRLRRGGSLTLPIQFAGAGSIAFTPEQGKVSLIRPEATATLRVHAGERMLDGVAPTTLRRGDRLDLRVELVRSGGIPVDVTRDPNTRYDVVVPWNLYVPEAGRLLFDAEPGWEDEVVSDGTAVAISYRDDSAGVYAARDLRFRLEGKAQSDARKPKAPSAADSKASP